ncbi:TlpA family protein disulfide reductase [Dyella soli]|uniref:TlpA family protein disulfide reductase n=1 Tax=Dyella soli TaxID=522319 RepID=A0A4R0YN69_9GAMM|nr:TlpA disulfide reductase family protein [Dyella soli]TCI07259.1 TlpA family protein disulfide reductase [Dyella soli]
MQRAWLLASILCATLCWGSLHAAQAIDDEPHFIASLQLGSAPDVRYLDAAGRTLDYAAFAHQLREGRTYHGTRDTRSGQAVLRIAGAAPGHRGIRLAFGRGDAFPPFELPSLHGDVQRLSALRGRYTLVSFFFAECGPCIAEVPALNAYARAHGDMNFVAITYEDAATARRFQAERGLAWPILHDGQALIDVLGVDTYPTLMLVDPAGRLAGTAVGMTLRQDDGQRQAELGRWIELWKGGGAR